MPESKSPESVTDPELTSATVEDDSEDLLGELPSEVADEEVAPVTKTVTATKAEAVDPKKAERARQHELKVKQKAEADARKADIKKYALAEKEAAKTVKAAELVQRKADKAKVAADSAQAAADKANEAVSEDATDAAKAKAAKATEAATAALQTAAELQQEAKLAHKKANKLRAGQRLSTQTKTKTTAPGSRQWVPPTFITVGLLGVIWLVVYYITASVGIAIPVMSDLQGWNVLIGMGLMAAAFGIATLWT